MKTRIDVNIPVTIFKEGKNFIAYSPVLDLSTSARSFSLAKKRFDEALELFFEELIDMGTVDEVLSDLGWIKQNHAWSPPLPVAHEMTSVSISLPN